MIDDLEADLGVAPLDSNPDDFWGEEIRPKCWGITRVRVCLVGIHDDYCERRWRHSASTVSYVQMKCAKGCGYILTLPLEGRCPICGFKDAKYVRGSCWDVSA